MNGYLIDTNVVSEFSKPMPNQQVRDWFDRAGVGTVFASVITFGEIRLGLEDMPPSRRRSELEFWFEAGLPFWLVPSLLPVTREIADRWGKLTIKAKRSGLVLTTADGLIAATALQHDLVLATRNVKDFTGLGVTIFDPWMLSIFSLIPKLQSMLTR